MTIRQFTLLRDEISSAGLTVDKALYLNQTTFGSVCYRKWVIYVAHKHKFVLSRDGREQLLANVNLNLQRAHNNGQFGNRVGWRSKVVNIQSKVD